MKTWQDFEWQLLIGLLVIFFGGWVLGIVMNLAAMAIPQMVSIVFCPAGSTATQNSDLGQQRPNDSTLSCHDPNGKYVPTLSDAESVVLQRKYFYRPSTIIMIILVIVWFIRSSIRQKKRNQANM
jgi:hypothetical protein